MAQANWRRDEKQLYLPGSDPVLLDVGELRFFMLDGEGDPNGPAFSRAVEALYSLSYAVRMSYRQPDPPAGYEPYTVYPLEGVWDLVDRSLGSTDKDNLKYTLMIRQPEFVDDALFNRFLEAVRSRKDNPDLARVRFGTLTEGPCCQALHLGPFEDEPATFTRMEQYCLQEGFVRRSKLHREIYLSDPRRTGKDKLRTVLRFSVDPR